MKISRATVAIVYFALSFIVAAGFSAFFVDMANYCQVSNKSAFRNASFFGWSHHELF
jgi:bacteriorhodopsin